VCYPSLAVRLCAGRGMREHNSTVTVFADGRTKLHMRVYRVLESITSKYAKLKSIFCHVPQSSLCLLIVYPSILLSLAPTHTNPTLPTCFLRHFFAGLYRKIICLLMYISAFKGTMDPFSLSTTALWGNGGQDDWMSRQKEEYKWHAHCTQWCEVNLYNLGSRWQTLKTNDRFC
jgi:hypothetical protein